MGNWMRHQRISRSVVSSWIITFDLFLIFISLNLILVHFTFNSARVSDQIEWIKTIVCAQSDYPPSYLCGTSTASPVSPAPTSASPISASPTSASPITASPTSASPVSASPISASPTANSPTSSSPVASPPTGSGPQNASFDSSFGVPACGSAGSSCSSGTLLNGRGDIWSGVEPNEPNT